MFAEVVNDEFLLRAARRVGRYLERVVESWGLPEPLFDEEIDGGPFAIFFDDDGDEDPDDGWIADLSAGGIQEVIDQLASAARQLQTERTTETAWICIPSIPILAILQTQLTRAFELQPDAHPRLDDIFDQEVPRNVGLDEPRAVGRRYAVPDGEHWYLGDPRWLWMKVVRGWHKHIVRDKVSFGGLPLKPVDIADDARIVLVGDWGSGLERAQRVADKIRNVLAERAFEGKQQYVIHLGDVYYTGARREYVDNFLRYWPVDHGQPYGSFIVCGNHDLYRGGRDYYRTALTDSRFAQQDGKSVFALRNSDWQFLGLDTAYVERQLSNGQDGWLEDQLRSAGGRRTTLLSHHPLWSDYKPEVGARLRDQIDAVLKKGGSVDAWFWGHEHRCAVFGPQPPVRFTSCVGNGGIPSFLTARMGVPYRLGVKYEYRDQYGSGPLPWNMFGFAVIDLDGPRMHVRYINEFGVEHHEEFV